MGIGISLNIEITLTRKTIYFLVCSHYSILGAPEFSPVSKKTTSWGIGATDECGSKARAQYTSFLAGLQFAQSLLTVSG
jgi:hypothetical protein